MFAWSVGLPQGRSSRRYFFFGGLAAPLIRSSKPAIATAPDSGIRWAYVFSVMVICSRLSSPSATPTPATECRECPCNCPRLRRRWLPRAMRGLREQCKVAIQASPPVCGVSHRRLRANPTMQCWGSRRWNLWRLGMQSGATRQWKKPDRSGHWGMGPPFLDYVEKRYAGFGYANAGAMQRTTGEQVQSTKTLGLNNPGLDLAGQGGACPTASRKRGAADSASAESAAAANRPASVLASDKARESRDFASAKGRRMRRSGDAPQRVAGPGRTAQLRSFLGVPQGGRMAP